jgi:type VI secretion system protein ImpG
VFSVDDVRGISSGSSTPFHFEPLYSFRHARNGEKGRAFWFARRRPAGWRTDQGTDVYLSFVDLSGRTVQPDHDSVTVELTCHNGDLPSRLQFGVESGDFEMPGGGPLEKIVSRIKPTPVIEPPLGRARLWRLISQLSLNYVSLVDGGAEGLRELLHLHNLGDSSAAEKQIEGLREVHSRPAYARIDSEHGLSFARGHRVEIVLDESRFVGGGAYLFASVLERFLGLYSALNSFCVLAARSEQRKEPLAEWPPRAGWKTLL